jgi:hypothetical protein
VTRFTDERPRHKKRARILVTRANGLTLTRTIAPYKTCVWTDALNRRVASARRLRAGRVVRWMLRVPGHQWPSSGEGSVPAGIMMPVKGFPTWQEADMEVERLWNLRVPKALASPAQLRSAVTRQRYEARIRL